MLSQKLQFRTQQRLTCLRRGQTSTRQVRVGVTKVVRAQGQDGKSQGQGFMGGLGNMSNLMDNVRKAQEMVRSEAQRVQEELATTEFEGYDEDETVKVVVTGNQEPKVVELTQEAYDTGIDELSSRVTEAMKEAHSKSVAGMKERMGDMAQKLGLPSPPQF
eukprot:TRINITY_DN14930_c0_g5_i1.p1 TRINITY_DN14930_c0_g5~~TRINITY_DN14930_c0_g5_i1.p1  ORF type:complete len:184 (-),score=26.46 TRINITY_DN14930_c0_g5_i1:145-627(-)